ncbi:MAG: metal-sensing transcriptional repressor [Blautia sp.]|nr:metal-sensing transcriptional repressor [Blautia sp.]
MVEKRAEKTEITEEPANTVLSGTGEAADGAAADCCHTERYKDRSEKEQKALLRRLSIIEGQIRGIRGMLERNVYCVDILAQVSAANCALNSFSRELLSEHLRTCVAQDLKEGKEEKLEETLKLLPKLMK